MLYQLLCSKYPSRRHCKKIVRLEEIVAEAQNVVQLYFSQISITFAD